MAIYSVEDLLNLEQKGQLKITAREDYSPFSLNLHLEKLYHYKSEVTGPLEADDLSTEEFLKQYCDEINISEGRVISSKEFYLWQPREEIFLAAGLGAEIVSRSSWARMGVRVQSCENALRRYGGVDAVKPLCSLITRGTTVFIKPDDAMGQLIVDDDPGCLMDGEMQALVSSGELVIKRDGKDLKLEQLSFDQGLILTMGYDLHVYRGGLLQPGKATEYFERVLLQPGQKKYFPQGAFFLSACSEYFEIPDSYVGYVTERESGLFLLPFSSHPNAPYIGPKEVFKGRITFENLMLLEGQVFWGMEQSKLVLKPLKTPLQKATQSRYTGQAGATTSKL